MDIKGKRVSFQILLQNVLIVKYTHRKQQFRCLQIINICVKFNKKNDESLNIIQNCIKHIKTTACCSSGTHSDECRKKKTYWIDMSEFLIE